MTEQEQIEKIKNIIGKCDGTENQDDVIYSQVAYLSVEEMAETLVRAGIGDTKQAVREFAEKLKGNLIKVYKDCLLSANKCLAKDDRVMYKYWRGKVDGTRESIDLVLQAVKETCGE